MPSAKPTPLYSGGPLKWRLSKLTHRRNAMFRYIVFSIVFCFALPLCAEEVLFQIGRPDGFGAEFRKGINWEQAKDQQGSVHKFVVGKNRTLDWIPQHLSTREFGNAGKSFQVE